MILQPPNSVKYTTSMRCKLKPSKVIWHRLFLLNVYFLFVNAENVAFGIESFYKTITYSTGFDNVNRK